MLENPYLGKQVSDPAKGTDKNIPTSKDNLASTKGSVSDEKKVLHLK